MKDINITFVNYLHKDDILKAVESLVSDIQDSPYDIQITVVDNSQDRDAIRNGLQTKYNQAKYIYSKKNIGFGRANTLGFKETPARYYFSLNRDTIIPENSKTINRIIKFMDDHPKIGCVGPKLKYLDGDLQHSCYRFDPASIRIKPFKQIRWDEKYKWVQKHSDKLQMKDFEHNETRPVDWVLGAAMVVRNEVVDQIGWFDDRYFMYLEDCDWCRTMWENGWPVYYLHDVEIYHRYDRGSAKVPGVVKALTRNKLARVHLWSWFKYMWKWRGKHRFYAR